MISELSQEDIVTRLLVSNEIVKKSEKNFTVVDADININNNLGKFIKETNSTKDVNFKDNDKYSFIKNGLWNY